MENLYFCQVKFSIYKINFTQHFVVSIQMGYFLSFFSHKDTKAQRLNKIKDEFVSHPAGLALLVFLCVFET